MIESPLKLSVTRIDIKSLDKFDFGGGLGNSDWSYWALNKKAH